MVNMTMVPTDDVAVALDALVKATTGAVGMNFLMPFLDVAAVEVAASRVRVVEFFYAEPDAALVARVHEGGALAAWQVGSLTEAQRAVDAGCDFIVAQGIEAGGHVRGEVSLLPLLDAVLDTVEVPVLAAGGIGTPRAMAAALAAGVRVGSRFVATHEANAHPAYVESLVRAQAANTVRSTAASVMWPAANVSPDRSVGIDSEGSTSDFAPSQERARGA